MLLRFITAAGMSLQNFCSNTSIHGLKLVWLVTCALGLVGAGVLIGEVWRRYRCSPTLTAVESTLYPIWRVPFPAVTVCNVNKVFLPAAKELYKKRNLSGELYAEEYWSFVMQLAEAVQPEAVQQFKELGHLETTLAGKGLSMESLMRQEGEWCSQLTQPCESLLVKCKWRGELEACGHLFASSKTDSGFCCSFNYSPPEGRRPYGERTATRRANGAGYITGLTMLLDPRLDAYYAALFSFYGLQILVHSPHEYPDILARGLILPPRKEAFMQISAESTYSSAGVRALPPGRRRCLVAGEAPAAARALGHSRYSYANCLVRCKILHVLALCNCTPYYYPPINVNRQREGNLELNDIFHTSIGASRKSIFIVCFSGTTRQCGLMDVQCLAKYRKIFNNVRPATPEEGLGDGGGGEDEDRIEDEPLKDGMRCDCPPACSDILYRTETSMSDFFKSEYDRTHFFHEVDINNHSILHVFFKDLSSIRFRRDVLYGWNDLLASFGGIVGLFLGCSLLSAVEVVYFLTLRPLCAFAATRRPRPLHLTPARPILIPRSQKTALVFPRHELSAWM